MCVDDRQIVSPFQALRSARSSTRCLYTAVNYLKDSDLMIKLNNAKSEALLLSSREPGDDVTHPAALPALKHDVRGNTLNATDRTC